jgi:hypothetical protein
MPGVRLLMRIEITTDGMRERGGWRSGLLKASPAVADGLTSTPASSGRHGAGWMSLPTRRAMSGGLKMDAI